jgi:hypothetical protein
MAFRAFQISPQLQERYGYPALTPALKAKILGLNAARLFGVDPVAVRCALDSDKLVAARAQTAAYHREGVLDQWQRRGPVSRREMFTSLRSLNAPWTP